MRKQHKWLHGEVERWHAERLIDDRLAVTLTARYPLVGSEWSRFILSAIGAILAGLGVILSSPTTGRSCRSF